MIMYITAVVLITIYFVWICHEWVKSSYLLLEEDIKKVRRSIDLMLFRLKKLEELEKELANVKIKLKLK